MVGTPPHSGGLLRDKAQAESGHLGVCLSCLPQEVQSDAWAVSLLPGEAGALLARYLLAPLVWF